jgi:secreted trypsin-like serine protease
MIIKVIFVACVATLVASVPLDDQPPFIQPRQTSCSCGIRNVNGVSRIVGGTQTKNGEFPWRVTVFVYDPATGRGGLCGGTIISASWIMTAAHCTMDMKTGYKISVFVGAQANPLTVGGGTRLTTDKYVQHPAFDRNTMNNDITLVHLTTPLTFKSNVSPACLPWNYATSEFTGTSVVASGWGTTKPVAVNTANNDSPSNTLMSVVLPILDTAQCQKYLGSNVNSNMICTYNPGKDTCQGDSGGSIDWQNNGRYYTIGVVSFGFGCAQPNYPGVYTKVTKYLPWIQSTTADNFCKA